MNKLKLFISTLLTTILICFNSICLAKLNLNFLPLNGANHAAHQYDGKRIASPEIHAKSKLTSAPMERSVTATPNTSKPVQKTEAPLKTVHRPPLLTAHILKFATQKVVAQTDNPANLGLATYYSDAFHGRRTASGEIYDKHKLTAVHMFYPFGTLLRVTNLQNHRSVTVKVNDRGRLAQNHLVDLSKQAAVELGIITAGKAMVKIETVQSDDT